MNALFTLGEAFRFNDSSAFRKKARDVKCRFYHSFVAVWVSWVAESCRSRAESAHLLKLDSQWGKRWKSSSVVDSRRLRKTGQDAQDDVIELFDFFMPFFGAGKAYRIWTRKRGPPQFFKRFCCLALPGAPNCEPCFGVAVWPRLVCPLNVLS